MFVDISQPSIRDDLDNTILFHKESILFSRANYFENKEVGSKFPAAWNSLIIWSVVDFTQIRQKCCYKRC